MYITYILIFKVLHGEAKMQILFSSDKNNILKDERSERAKDCFLRYKIKFLVPRAFSLA